MISLLTRLRFLALAVLLSLTALSASCDNIGAPSLDDDEGGEEATDLGRTQLPLVEDRKVTVVPWVVTLGKRVAQEPAEATLVKTEKSPGLLSSLTAQCANVELRQRYEGATCSALSEECRDAKLPAGPVITDEVGGVGASLIFTCMATIALSIAEANTSYYLSRDGVSSEPPSASTYVEVRPSATSDRASWALLAVDLYRESAEVELTRFGGQFSMPLLVKTSRSISIRTRSG